MKGALARIKGAGGISTDLSEVISKSMN